MIDVCLENAAPDGSAPKVVTTRQLAEKVLEFYWPQTAPITAGAETKLLTQSSTGQQAEILTAIVKFKAAVASDVYTPFSRSQRLNQKRFEDLVAYTEWKLAEMPVPRVQVVGDTLDEFLYRIAWNDSIKRREFDSPSFDRNVYLCEGAGETLIRIAALLRPLIQRQWAKMVATLNRDVIEDARLEEFLFGTQRISTEPVRTPLRDLQNNRFFYCDNTIKGVADVDHFLPWVRHPDNALENLVVTDQRCNNYKRDFLAAASHVARWRETRLRRSDSALVAIAEGAGWERHPERTLAVARSLYLRLPGDSKLWLRGREFVMTDLSSLAISLE